MVFRRTFWRLSSGIVLLTTLYAFQRPFRVYPSMEPYDDIPMPTDWQEKTEWVQSRLMYPQHPNALFARYRYGSMDWREGGTSWTQDYPRADRHFATALRRLTRLDVRSVEQPVNLDDEDDVYNWPWLAAGEMGDWLLTPTQAAKLRDYLLRGGFLYLDDFWGPQEWASFETSMKAVFPDREIIEIDNADQIFHSVFNLDDRYQILGQWALPGRGGGRGNMFNNRVAGTVAEWKGIRDDKERLVVAMSFNSDV